jgi:hypothetical protein
MAIRINGITGPKLDALTSTPYSFTTTTTGIVTYAWSIVSAPPGNTATLTGASTSTASLTPSNEGTYLIRLTATTGSGTTQETTVLAVPSITSGLRVPAYAETIEAGSTGWDQGAGDMLRSLDLAREQPGVMACVADATITPGLPVTIGYDPGDPMFSAGASLKLGGLPGERSFPKAFAGVTAVAPLVGIAIGTPTGGTASAGDIVLVRVSGLYQGLSITYTVASSDYPYLYPDGAGGLTDVLPTSESNSRCVGKVASWSSGIPGVGSVVNVMVYGDRVPRIKTVEFGSNSSTNLSSASESWFPMGTDGPSTTAYFGQFVPALDGNALTILATAKVWAATPYSVATTFRVKNARTTADFGSSFVLASSASEASAGFWAPFDITDPVGFTGQIASGSTSPKAIAATLTFWEL